MTEYKCNICGGDLVLTIGADVAICDHCGQAAPVDPRDVKEYQRIYQNAEALMRNGTLAGCTEALTRLQSISFIPQEKEKAALCERRIEELRRAQENRTLQKKQNDGKDTAIGVIGVLLIVLFLLAVVAGVGYAIWRLSKGSLSQTEIIVMVSVAVVLAVLLIINKIRQ